MGIAHAGEVIWRYEEPIPEIKPFASCTNEELTQYLDLHYKGRINITDYWKVGDTRVMHLSAMASGTGASESHVAQNMTMVIIGMEHDTLKEPINGKTKAAITLQCREFLGNNGKAEDGYIWGTKLSTGNGSSYASNPRRTWLNRTFINALPSAIKPLVKTVIKKNLPNHRNTFAGPNTEDKAFLTSCSEMFGNNNSISSYNGSEELEGKHYPYYSSDARRSKSINNNGVPGSSDVYWLRSPSYKGDDNWIYVYSNGSGGYGYSVSPAGIAPAFCL